MPSLYLTQPGSRLELDEGRFVCLHRDEQLLAVPSARVSQVVIVSGCHVTTPALLFMLDQRIDLLFVSASGAFRGRLDSGDVRNQALRREQYRRSDDAAFCLDIARAMLEGKLRNARTRCMELDTDNDPRDLEAIDRLRDARAQLADATSLNALMLIEGRAARAYFGVLRRHLREPWQFEKRMRRPPPDPVNALLSIAYTLLHEQCRSALIGAGLDPMCGCLHQPRAGRASLALDLMEEFRPVIADTVAWTLLNKRMLAPADFSHTHDGGVRLNPDGWKQFARHFTRRLDTPILLPERATRTTYRKLVEIQARKLARVIQGGEDRYEPYLAR